MYSMDKGAGLVELTAQTRTVEGKQVAQLRRAGWIPGVIYGHGFEAIPLQFEVRHLQSVFSKVTGSQLISINIEGRSEPEKVLVRDVQVEPISRRLSHVDFYRVSMNEKLRAEVPVELVGDAPAVRRSEGILLHGVSSIVVHCLPADLMEVIRVDISKLEKVDDDIHVRDLVMPAGVQILTDADALVVRVTPLARAEVEVEAAPVAATTGEVETVREQKAKEKAAEEGEAPAKK
jgi:large subunit ribosomal protein L25